MKIILGSASKQRKRVLERSGHSFDVMTADIDEKAIRFDDPKELTMALAKAKAEVLLSCVKEPALLITADQVVVWNGRILEKPENAREAREFLKGYAKHPAQPVNATVVTNTKTGKQTGENNINAVYFRPFPSEVVEQLIQEKNIFSQAGAFSLEDPLVVPYVDHIEGTLDSIEGLPMEILERLLKEAEEY
jgi:septum formation protein